MFGEPRNTLILSALARILRPLLRLLVALGVNFKEFSGIAKRIYLDESVQMLKGKDKEITSSALSIISGIHRKETSLFLKNPKVELSEELPGASSTLAVVTEWITNPDYLDENKKPAPLIYSQDGVEKSFYALSNKVIRDVRPKAVLDELLRLDLVEFKDNIVRLKKEAFVPQADLNEKLRFFSKNISEHLDAASTNVLAQQPPFFERSAFHDGLSEQDIQKIDALVREKGMDLLKEAYLMAEQLAQKSEKSSRKHRITLGIFMNHDKQENVDQVE